MGILANVTCLLKISSIKISIKLFIEYLRTLRMNYPTNNINLIERYPLSVSMTSLIMLITCVLPVVTVLDSL